MGSPVIITPDAPAAPPITITPDPTPPPTPSAFQRLGESALSGAGVVTNEQGKNFFLHPVDTLKAMANLQGELGERAQKELANKDYVRGLTHAVEWLMPGLGPTLAKSGDQLESGDVAGGVGTTLGAAANLLAGAKGPAIADAAGDAASAVASKAAAGVRATARGVNTALEKAPGTIGATVGATVGAKVGGGPGAALGGIAGEVAGKELLPKLHVPGEGFGLPNRVTGGPAVLPSEPAAASAAADDPFAEVDFLRGKLGNQEPEIGGEAPPVTIIRPGAPAAAEPTPSGEESTPGTGAGIPRTLSGESALRDVLSRQDNANLTRIAKSRGINITQESQLKPSLADKRLIDKIVDDYDDDELENMRSIYMENTRFPRADWAKDVGAEANKTLAMQTYFPDVKIPATVMKRTQTAIAAAKTKPVAAPGQVDDLTSLLQESLKRAQQKQPTAGAQ